MNESQNGSPEPTQSHSLFSEPASIEPVSAEQPVSAEENGNILDMTATFIGDTDADSRFISRSQSPSLQRLGRYRFVKLLGRGGFAEVWLAEDEVLHREVAVKVPREDRVFSPEQVAKFLEEARTLAQLDHPHILPVFDFGEDEGRCYVVSKYAAGQTLEQRLSSGPLPLREAVQITEKIARALQEAHLADIVHRDLKPANIFFDQNGEPLLGDFGLAVSETNQLWEKPGVRGTLSYMSPEQAEGNSHTADARSDIYSLGVVFYQMLTGRLPFFAPTLVQYRQKILESTPRPLRTIDDTIPAEVERICLKCLKRRIEDRYNSAIELAEELGEVLSQLPAPTDLIEDSVHTPATAPQPPSTIADESAENAPQALRRRSALLKIGGGLFAAGGLGALGWSAGLFSQRGVTPQPAPKPKVDSQPNLAKLYEVRLEQNDEEVASWAVIDEGNGVRIAAVKTALLKLGTYHGGHLKLEGIFDQPDHTWPGQFGFFFGFRKNVDIYRLQYYVTYLYRTLRDKKHILFINRIRYKKKSPFAVISSELAEWDLEKLDWHPKDLSLQFQNRHLEEVRFAGKNRGELMGRLLNYFQKFQKSPMDFTGDFGIFCRETSVTVNKLRINGLPLTLEETQKIKQG